MNDVIQKKKVIRGDFKLWVSLPGCCQLFSLFPVPEHNGMVIIQPNRCQTFPISYTEAILSVNGAKALAENVTGKEPTVTWQTKFLMMHYK